MATVGVEGLRSYAVTYCETCSRVCVCVSYFSFVDVCCSETENAGLERLIRNKLKDIMMTVDLEEVTSKYVRDLLTAVFDCCSVAKHVVFS